MTNVDVIILANTANGYIRAFTQKAIDSLRNSEDKFDFNIILVESNKKAQPYNNVNTTLIPEENFSYNKFLNIAYSSIIDKGEYLIVANNDVEFHKNWLTILLKEMNNGNYATGSPKSPTYQFGINPIAELNHRLTAPGVVRVGHQSVITFCGWCWVTRNTVAQEIFPLDEQFLFFFQDDDICLTLKSKGYTHCMVSDSHVSHMGQQSHDILKNQGNYLDYTWNLKNNFINKWG